MVRLSPDGAVNAAAPYTWSPELEAAYDSPIGRWLAFSTINSLNGPDTRRLWLGHLMSAQPFFFSNIALRQALWPPWLSPYFHQHLVRFCPACARLGYHSIFHQWRGWTECAWHRQPLTQACSRCGATHAYNNMEPYLPHANCRTCHTPLFPVLAARYRRTPGFLAQEKLAFGAIARAVAYFRRIQIIPVIAFDDNVKELTSEPTGPEILVGLSHAGLLPQLVRDALVCSPAPPLDIALAPVVTLRRDRRRATGWKRRLAVVIRQDRRDVELPRDPARHYCSKRMPFAWLAERHCKHLGKPVEVDRLDQMLPPDGAATWDIAIRAFWQDQINDGRPGLNDRADRCLRHWLYVDAPGRLPQWIVMRTLAPAP